MLLDGRTCFKSFLQPVLYFLVLLVSHIPVSYSIVSLSFFSVTVALPTVLRCVSLLVFSSLCLSHPFFLSSLPPPAPQRLLSASCHLPALMSHTLPAPVAYLSPASMPTFLPSFHYPCHYPCCTRLSVACFHSSLPALFFTHSPTLPAPLAYLSPASIPAFLSSFH